MVKVKDLTGQIFGRLEVIRLSTTGVNGLVTWECKCSCGSTEVILASTSNLGNSKNSCGCLKKEALHERHKSNIKDLTGQRFGKLVARKRVVNHDKSVSWLCDCDCGGDTSVLMSNLGRVTNSCGCLYSESARKRGMDSVVDLTGKIYGRLTVLGLSDTRIRDVVTWTCKCICGNLKDVTTAILNDGGCKSCGCLVSDTGKDSIKMLHEIVKQTELKENTRLCILNQKVGTNNTSGTKGVSWVKAKRKWKAVITIQGKTKHLGYFDNIDDAIKSRKQGEIDYFEPILNKYGRELKQ